MFYFVKKFITFFPLKTSKTLVIFSVQALALLGLGLIP